MAYRLPRPGVIEVYTEGRHTAIVVLACFAAVTAGVLAWVTLTSGWQLAMLAPLAVVGLLGGVGLLVLRADETTITSEGICPIDAPPHSEAAPRVLEVRIGVEINQHSHASGTSRPRIDYCVDLVLDSTSEAGESDVIQVMSSTSEPVARQAAEEIARHMLWPLEDVIGDDAEIRSPDALDLRAERKPEPTEPPPRGITRFERNGETVLGLSGVLSDAQRQFVPLAIGGSIASSAVAALMVTTMLEGTMLGLAIGTIVLGDALIVGGIIGVTRVRTELTVRHGSFHQDRYLGPIRAFSTKLDLRKVERVRVQTRDPVTQGCVLVCDDETLRIGRGLEKPALEWLRDWTQSRLP